MPRKADSAADRELTARLAAHGLAGSSARYERWRRAGLLPRHERRGAGRGRGSTSTLAPATVEIAAALARHAVQGRDLRAAVVAWFFDAGRPAAGDEPPVPEPPGAAVVDALAWAVRAGSDYRLLQRARAAVTEAQKDDFYAAATAQARREPDASVGFDPSAVREALINGADIHFASSGKRTEVVHLIAALGLGIEEVGAEAFADAFAATGLFPQLTVQEWRDVMNEATTCGCGSCAEALADLARFDPAKAVKNAQIERLRQAREVAIGLAGFGALLMMHALLMPDTPGLAALRVKINQLAAGPVLMNLARQVMRPQYVASAIATCLRPEYFAMYKSLSESVAAGPPLLHEAGREHNPERYMQDWISSINALSIRS